MEFCIGALVLISTPPDDTNSSLSLSHVIERPGKLFATVQPRENEFPSMINDVEGRAIVIVGRTGEREKEMH